MKKIYRYYYICPQCLPESFEDFYLNVYPALSDVTPENKQQRQKLSTYLSEKNIKAVSLPSLLRTHALGSEPSIGDHVHICEHMDKWLVPIIIQVDDGFTEIEAYGDEGENVEQPDFLIFCPTCIAEWDPEEIYEVVEEKTWNKRIQRWLKKTYPIFRTATEFFEWLFEKLEEEAEDIEDYEYNGPVLGEPVLLCDHLDPEMLIEEAEIEPIFSDRSQFTLPGSDVSPLWIAACTECTSQTDTPYQVAQSKTKNKQLHHWTHSDTVKLVVEDIGDQFVHESGLTAEPLVNAICEILDAPEQFFDQNSLVWQITLNWAPEFFDTQLAPEGAPLGDDIKHAHLAGEGWITRHEKHPLTKQASIVHENAAVIFEDYDFVVLITTTLDSDPILDNSIEEALQNTGGVKFTITVIESTDRKELAFLFDNQFKVEEFVESLPEEGEFEVDIIELE